MEKQLLPDCPFCEKDSAIFSHLLQETEHFRLVADRHPVQEGHVLVVPKEHFCCIGECPDNIFAEFETLYRKVTWFLRSSYGAAAAFERGRIHRTVFHSQVHFLPFHGDLSAIVPEGRKNMAPLRSLRQLQAAYQEDDGYQFLAADEDLWLVNPDLSSPKFFRSRFAETLGARGRADWQEMHDDPELMAAAAREIELLKERWFGTFPHLISRTAPATLQTSS